MMDTKTTSNQTLAPIRVAIVGTAGRKDDAPKMSAKLFLQMCTQVDNLIKTRYGVRPVSLISGGASWSDHVAVRLFNNKLSNIQHLKVCLPCDWKDGKPQNNHEGAMMTDLHTEFAKTLQIKSTLDELEQARKNGAILQSYKGFLTRNTIIASECDFLIAFTFSKHQPQTGGTLDTWSKTKAPKAHISLDTWEVNFVK